MDISYENIGKCQLSYKILENLKLILMLNIGNGCSGYRGCSTFDFHYC